MKILIENKTSNYSEIFYPEFLEALEEEGHTIDKVISEIAYDIVAGWTQIEEYDKISKAYENEYISLEDIEEAVLKDLSLCQDKIIADKNFRKTDIISIINKTLENNLWYLADLA